MNIKDPELEFAGTLIPKDRDPYALSSVKIILCREKDKDSFDIYLLNQEYQKKNGIGVPYQYIIKKNGDVLFGRSRAYENGFDLPHFNLFRGAIAVLIEGNYNDEYTSAQRESIVELCAMIVIQDNILVSDITSQTEIFTGADNKLKAIIPDIRERVSEQDIYRTVGDEDSVSFYKIVSNEALNNITTISLYTFIPEDIIKQMNPHIINYDDIAIGTTIFLPGNKMFDYLHSSYLPMKINFVYENIRHSLKEYNEEV